MTQEKSILFLTKLYHPNIGGVENHVKNVSRLLAKKGYRVTILTEKNDNRLKSHEKVDGINIYRMDIPESVFLKKFYIWKWVITNLHFFVKFETIHVHDVFYWLYPVFPLSLLRNIYITFHGYEGFPIKKSWIFHRKVAEILTRGNICVGDFMKKWYFTSPSAVIYGGVSLTNKKRQVNSLSAVFFGRLDNQTGISEYIKAYKIVRKVLPGFSLTVVGEGELASKIPSSVNVVPFQENVEKYIASNRFILVSRYLSMLEALVQKREVIATYDNPVKKDYLLMSPFANHIEIGKNGQDIAKIILLLVKGGVDQGKIEKGYQWASKQSWEKVVDVYFNLWKKRSLQRERE